MYNIKSHNSKNIITQTVPRFDLDIMGYDEKWWVSKFALDTSDIKDEPKLIYAFRYYKYNNIKDIVDYFSLESNGIKYSFILDNYPEDVRILKNMKAMMKRLSKETNNNSEEVLKELKGRLSYHLNYKKYEKETKNK